MSIESARKRAKKYFKYHNLSLPVDIESILSKYADIEETYIPFNGDAICINNKSHPRVFIKSNISPYRKRFTYAHELGHLQIPSHTGLISCTTELSEHINMNAYNQMEQEANAFAAELLMPEGWIISLVSKFATVKSLLEHITQKANVSLTAAVYKLIPVLSSNYMFEINNKIDKYSHIKFGSQNEYPIILTNERHKIDCFWLSANCSDCEHIESDVLSLNIYKFKANLPDAKINQISLQISSNPNCQKACDQIVNLDTISYAHFFPKLMHFLESGIVIKLKCNESKAYRYLYSAGTHARPRLLTEYELDSWFSMNCLYHIVSKGIFIEVNVWHLYTTFHMYVDENDKRDSKLILRSIIENQYYDSKERASIYGCVNGIIGALNSSTTEYTRQQFYDILKQKYLSRANLSSVTNHKDFNQYLYRKVEELYSKK